MKVAFIGLGIMGSRMAANLLKNGVDLTVYNRSQAPVESLRGQGAHGAASVQRAVAEADIVFSMLSTPEVVAEIFLGENGALSAMKKNAVWVDCSTVNPSFSREAHAAARQHKVRFIDAPVAGTKPQAQTGDLAFFVGGAPELLEEVTPLLEHMGSKVLPMGESGQGAALKMLVNLMLAQSMTVFAETLILGEKMGLSRDFLLNVLPGLVVSAPFTKFKADMIRADDYTVQFPLEWMHKDLHLATLTAYENSQPLYLASVTKELFADAKKSGLGRLDFAAIYQFLNGVRKTPG